MYSGGSVWDFQYEGGSFEVEFRADSFNHFNCITFPAHSHWLITDPNTNTIFIDFGRYGKYEMILSLDTATHGYVMNGCKQGQTDNWRKCVYKHQMGAEGLILSDSGHGHDHSHDHVHTATCGHHH